MKNDMPPANNLKDVEARQPLFSGVDVNARNGHQPTPGKFFDASAIDFDETGQEDFEHLGALLLHLRLSYMSRLRAGMPHGAKVMLRATAVADYLKEHGYSMSSGSYSLLEQGKTLPGDAIRFFNLLCECLLITPESKYRPLLMYQYLYDSAVRSIGQDFADEYAPRGAQALQALRERVRQQTGTPPIPVGRRVAAAVPPKPKPRPKGRQPQQPQAIF